MTGTVPVAVSRAAGIVAVSDVALTNVVPRAVGPNITVAPVTNDWPVIVSVVFGLPLGRLVGERVVIDGTGFTTVIVLLALVPLSEAVMSVWPCVSVVTVTGALSWLAGTVTVPGTVATEAVLLLRVMDVGVVWTALSVTVNVPVLPRTMESVAGCRLATGGAGITVNEAALVPVPANVMTAIGPLVAVGGTTAMSVVGFVTVKVGARTPLKITVCTFTKFVPVTVTEVPGCPLVGVNPVTVGAGKATSTWLATLAPLRETVTVVEPVAMAVTGIGRLVWPVVKATEAGTVTTLLFELMTVAAPAAVGAGASVAVRLAVTPTVRTRGLGVSAVGCAPAPVSSTPTVMKLPGALVRRTSIVLLAWSATVRSMTATFWPKSLGPAICRPLSLMVADEMRFVPLALPLRTCSV